MAREVWTDERLDDLAKRMDKGFDEIKGEIRGLRTETKGEIGKLRADTNVNMRELRQEMRSDFDSVHARLDSLQRTMIICLATLSSGIIASLLAAMLAS